MAWFRHCKEKQQIQKILFELRIVRYWNK